MSNVSCLSWLCVAAVLAGCSSSPDGSPNMHAPDAATLDAATLDTTDADVPDASGQDASANDAAAVSDAASADAGPPPPTNVSFETAKPLMSGTQIMQRLLSATQIDFYSFEAAAGDWYEFTTDNTPFSPDNVITLFDSEHRHMAENDSGSLWPGDIIDARLVVRIQTAGTYYVQVEDRTIPEEAFTGDFKPALSYRLTFNKIERSTPAFAFEGADKPAEFVQNPMSGNWYVTLLGELNEKGADTFGFDGRDAKALIGELLDVGDTGDGSTVGPVTVRVITKADKHVLASIDASKGQANIHPPVSATAHQLTVTANGKTGDNGFYVVNLVMLQDNPVEMHDDQNGSLAMAEPIAMQGPVRRRGLLMSRLPAKDVDYYSFEAEKGEHAVVACESESGGSGVRGLHAELRDAKDQVFASKVESPLENALLDGIEVPTSGTQYVRLTSDAVDSSADAIEPWVRCVVIAGP